MRKKLSLDEIETRAKRREVKRRPRMKVHSASLRRPSKYAAGLLIKVKP